MSLFECARCGSPRDSDDGCEEYGKHYLICRDCLQTFPKIHVEHVYPPIPVRQFDWSAVTENYDGAPDAGPQFHGTGATRGEAIQNLIEQLDEAEGPIAGGEQVRSEAESVPSPATQTKGEG